MAQRDSTDSTTDFTDQRKPRKKIQGRASRIKRQEIYRQRKNVEALSDVHLSLKLNTHEWPAYEFKYFKQRVNFLHPDFKAEKENFLLWLAELAEETYSIDPDLEIDTSIPFTATSQLDECLLSSPCDLEDIQDKKTSWNEDVIAESRQHLLDTRIIASSFDSNPKTFNHLVASIQMQQDDSIPSDESVSTVEATYVDDGQTPKFEDLEIDDCAQDQQSIISNEVRSNLNGRCYHSNQLSRQQVPFSEDILRRRRRCSKALGQAISTGRPRDIMDYLIVSKFCSLQELDGVKNCVHQSTISKYIYLAEYEILRSIFCIVGRNVRKLSSQCCQLESVHTTGRNRKACFERRKLVENFLPP